MSTSASSDTRFVRSLPARTALLALVSCAAMACVTRTDGEPLYGASGGSSGSGAGGSFGGQAGASAAGAGAGSGGQAGGAGTGAAGQAGAAGNVSSGGAGGSAGGSSGSSGSSGSGGAPSGGGSGVSHVQRLDGALKILPFGDSITASTCYRARLAELLDAAHPADYDFVGTQSGDSGCGYTYDTAHEGHGGYLVTQHTGELTGWAESSPADVVLLHFATNDVWNGVATESILAAYGQAVDAFRAQNANVTILVAKLIPLEPDGCDHCDVGPLNDAIPAWASSKATEASAIIVVDQWTGYSAGADSSDKVHPNDSGSSKMASHWAAALDPLF